MDIINSCGFLGGANGEKLKLHERIEFNITHLWCAADVFIFFCPLYSLELHDHNGDDDLRESEATIFLHPATAASARNIYNLCCRWKFMRSLSAAPWPSGTTSSDLLRPLPAAIHNLECNLVWLLFEYFLIFTKILPDG
jgi:hypothetical protein